MSGRGAATDVGDAGGDRVAARNAVGMGAGHVEAATRRGGDRTRAGAAISPGDLGGEVVRVGTRVSVREMRDDRGQRPAGRSGAVDPRGGQRGVLDGRLERRGLRGGWAEARNYIRVGPRAAIGALLGVGVGALDPGAPVSRSRRGRAVPPRDRRARQRAGPDVYDLARERLT